MLVSIDQNNFRKEVLESRQLVLVNFWASWSEECKSMRRLMREIDQRIKQDGRVVEINWEAENELAQKYNVVGVPTLLIFDHGKLVERISGTLDASDFLSQLPTKSQAN